MGCAEFLILERPDSFTLSILWRIVWSLGNKCSSPPAAVAIVAEKLPVVTVESTVVTVESVVVTSESLLAEALRLCL